MNPAPNHPRFSEALRVWFKIGWLSFGGPTGQIALMHRELVERRRWVSDARFLHALNYCMLLPGPEAQPLAIYIGWLLHRQRGGVAAGALFVLPGALVMGVISIIYVYFGKIGWMVAVFDGLQPAVLAIVAAAVCRIGQRTLRHPLLWAIAGAAFIAIFVFKTPFPAVLTAAALLGCVGKRGGRFSVASVSPDGTEKVEYVVDDAQRIESPGLRQTLIHAVGWSAIWLAPLVFCAVFLGSGHLLSRESLFFSKAALVTFGGAYAVLPYVAQQAVVQHGWLSTGQMIDGLGLAETTPGPLVLVLQFVGFLAGWNHPGNLPPLAMAIAGAVVTAWATFVPGFLFIFAGAPWLERSRSNPMLTAMLQAVTAAVVGVVLNLAVWFGWHIFLPEPGTLALAPVLLAIGFFLLLQKTKTDVLWVVGLGALSGWIRYLIGF